MVEASTVCKVSSAPFTFICTPIISIFSRHHTLKNQLLVSLWLWAIMVSTLMERRVQLLTHISRGMVVTNGRKLQRFLSFMSLEIMVLFSWLHQTPSLQLRSDTHGTKERHGPNSRCLMNQFTLTTLSLSQSQHRNSLLFTVHMITAQRIIRIMEEKLSMESGREVMIL